MKSPAQGGWPARPPWSARPAGAGQVPGWSRYATKPGLSGRVQAFPPGRMSREPEGTTSLYEASHRLFSSHPLAARDVNLTGTIRAMVLMVCDGGQAWFFVLSQGCGYDLPLYSLCPWPSGDVVDVAGDGSVPEFLANAVWRGIPLPRHGSVFGWAPPDGAVDALVVVYTDHSPGRPLPCWSVLALAGVREVRWPPFTGRRFLGSWFWEEYRAGRIVLLDDLIADAPGAVFWVNTRQALGSACCAVARDVGDGTGPTVRRGRYVNSEALRAGRPVPSLTALLADTGKIDIAGRFRRPALRDGWPRAAA